MATIPTYPSKTTLTGDELIVISDTANDTRTRHATINSILTLMPGIPCCSLQGGYNSGGDVITNPGKRIFFDTSGGDEFRVTGTMTKDGAGPLSLLGDGTANSNIDGTRVGQTTPAPIKSTTFQATGSVICDTTIGVLGIATLANDVVVHGSTTMVNLDAADTSFQGTMTVGGIAASDATFHDDLTVLGTGVFTTSDAVITNAIIDSSDIGTITPGLVFGTNIANTSGGDVRPDDGKGLSVGAVGGIGSVEAVKSADNAFAHMDFSGTNPAVAPTTVYFHGQEQFMFTDSSNTGIGIAGGLVTYSGVGSDIADINAAGPKVAITKKWIEGPYLGNRTVDLGGFNFSYWDANAIGINDATPGVDGELFSINGKVKITDGSESAGFFLSCDANGVGTWTSVGAGALNLYTVNGNISDPVRLVGVGANQLSFNLDPAGLVDISGGTFKIDNTTTFNFEPGVISAGNIMTSDAFGNGTWQVPATPTTGTIYTSDGTLSGARIIDLDSNQLRFDNVDGGIGIGGDNVGGAQLSLRSTTQGFFLPTLTTAEVNALLPSLTTEGTKIFNDDQHIEMMCCKPGNLALNTQPFLSQGVNAATTPYAVPQTINFIYCDTSAVNLDINLASATTRALGTIIKVKDGTGSVAGTYNASVNNIVITPDGLETIDGVNAAQTIAVDGGYIELICDGSSNWWIGTSRLT